MIKRKFTIATLLFAVFSFMESSAQDVIPRVAGLESNGAYMDLLRSDEQIRIKTDSLMSVVRTIRMEMTKNAESRDEESMARADSLFVVLSNTESAIYALRTKKVKLIDQISTIEQNHVLSNMGNIGGAQSAQGRSLYNNDYFKKSLEAEDYKHLMEVHSKEAKAYEYVQTYVKNYSKIKSLHDNYLMTQEETEAEEIYAEIAEVMAENLILERMLGDAWSEIFVQKSYVYSYFLEKENRLDLLELAENMMNESQQEKLSAIDNCVSEHVVDYCLQKPLSLNYELYVAKLLNLPAAIDSLSTAARNVRSIDYRMPIIDIERRSFVNYEPIEFSSRSPYNTTTNPIPENVIYEYGTIYRIWVGTYKYRQQPNIFRGASPLYVEKREDGRFDYYVGGLHTRSEAESAVEIMKKKGFRDPQIIEWCDGVKSNLSKAEDGERISYRISITNGTLDDVVREVISTMAEGCQVSRLGENNFLVSPFASRATAERVAQAISKCDDALVVEVQEVKPEAAEENAEKEE